ncbi:MAG: hypothetical protein LBD52_05695 [Prevotellaceae bacterium]|jgi:hypothetical protein|nr:hypothetical protein [Prevotellaceae bacterium]
MLSTAILRYLPVSCLSLATAPGLRLSFPARWLFTAGVAGSVFSDTLTACCEFLNLCGPYHILMTPAHCHGAFHQYKVTSPLAPSASP